MKITAITRIHKGLYAHICPLCGNILASASESGMMPEFSICSCDRKEGKPPVYELAPDGTRLWRNTRPRFTARLSEDGSIMEVVWEDHPGSKDEARKALGKAVEFLRKRRRP